VVRNHELHWRQLNYSHRTGTLKQWHFRDLMDVDSGKDETLWLNTWQGPPKYSFGHALTVQLVTTDIDAVAESLHDSCAS
jgi:hypothetical protein